MTSAAKPIKRPGSFKRGLMRGKYVYLMFLPVAVYYIIFSYLPMYGIIIAFQDYQPGMSFFEGANFVGLKNFRELFSSPMFPKLVRNTLLLNLWALCIGFPAPIILALLLNEVRSSKFKRTVQTISYLPHFIAMVVVIGILKDVLSSEGLFNQVSKFFYVNVMGGDPSTFKPTLYLGFGIFAVYLYGYRPFLITDIQLLFGLADGAYQLSLIHISQANCFVSNRFYRFIGKATGSIRYDHRNLLLSGGELYRFTVALSLIHI